MGLVDILWHGSIESHIAIVFSRALDALCAYKLLDVLHRNRHRFPIEIKHEKLHALFVSKFLRLLDCTLLSVVKKSIFNKILNLFHDLDRCCYYCF